MVFLVFNHACFCFFSIHLIQAICNAYDASSYSVSVNSQIETVNATRAESVQVDTNENDYDGYQHK